MSIQKTKLFTLSAYVDFGQKPIIHSTLKRDMIIYWMAPFLQNSLNLILRLNVKPKNPVFPTK